jgi:DNA polymerase elongation subunit (family B)
MFTVDRLRKITSGSIAGKPIEYTNVIAPNLAIIDTLQQVAIWDKSASMLDGYGLKKVVPQLDLRAEGRTELTNEQIQSCYGNPEGMKVLRRYLIDDLRDTMALADFLCPVLWYQQNYISGLNFQALSVASPALKTQITIERLIGPCPYESDEKTQYVGALSQVYKTGFFENVSKIDITGMYPWIMVNYGCGTRKDPEQKSLEWLRSIVERRTELKRLAKLGDTRANHEQNALKIVANGFYGFLGTGFYSYNDMAAAQKVTEYGRTILTQMMDIIRDAGGDVIEIDTDGIYFNGIDGNEMLAILYEQLPDGIKIDLEFDNICLFSQAAKNYIAVASDGKATVKGMYRKRNRVELEKHYAVDITRARAILGKEFAQFYSSDVKAVLESGQLDVDMLELSQRIPKNAKSLVDLNIGKIGETVRYYYTSVPRVHKRTGKALKSVDTPTLMGDYSVDYYLDKLTDIDSKLEVVSCPEI